MTNDGELSIGTLESWLWEAACNIRGDVDAAKYKDIILPLIFYKRLSDVFQDELQKLAKDYLTVDMAESLLKQDHSLARFYIPKEARWESVSKETTGIGEHLTDAVRSIARENPRLQGVIDIVDFNATTAGQRVISDDRLRILVDIMGRHRLGMKDVEPDILGRAYEYLLKKFAEGSGQSAGEFYTPREVAVLMARMLDPQPGMEIYDPCCGSGGLLIKYHLRFREKYTSPTTAPPRFYGQEILASTFAMAKMNAFIHDMDAQIALGDTMIRPAFTTADTSLRHFDVVTANPMWNQKTFDQSVYERDTYSRFSHGYPTKDSADWGWIQHMYASLKPRGKMAVVLDTGAVSRGSGNVGRNRERDIRKVFVDDDLVEAVLLLPENLFYNTTAPGIVLVVNKAKVHKGEVLLINASQLFQKGRPKNYLPDENIERIADLYLNWREEDGVSKVVPTEEAARNDYNLSPSRYVAQDGGDDSLPLEDAVVLLQEAEEERRASDTKLNEVLRILGVEL